MQHKTKWKRVLNKNIDLRETYVDLMDDAKPLHIYWKITGKNILSLKFHHCHVSVSVEEKFDPIYEPVICCGKFCVVIDRVWGNPDSVIVKCLVKGGIESGWRSYTQNSNSLWEKMFILW